ncbi:GNAT family N-acetyltransferase [Luteipulveratus halotolerans]|uniref:GNAT family N-acetyltransferase n=1 Tax=Luteipulveratus halotolerans TaxID=1631356 RepID=UPI0008FC0919|nr:GNAT family N-acetyltransferase [Luteipulveratus halotolerans]
MSSDPRRLEATGARVRVSTVVESDLEPYRRAVEMSHARLSRWNPVDPHDLARHLTAQSGVHRTFVIHALAPTGGHDIVGKVNVTNIVRGRFQNATIGYDAYDPYVGRGLFGEGLRLVVSLVFAPEPRGLGLHRIDANVQPGNAESMGVLRSLGFRREGHAVGLLWLGGSDGTTAWRDHEAHAITADEWPALAYQPHRPARTVMVVNGLPGSGKTTLARALSQELGVPLLSKDLIKEAVGGRLDAADRERLGGTGSPLGAGAHEALWSLLEASPAGAVVESWFPADAVEQVRRGLERAGMRAESVPQIWCEAQGETQARPYDLGPVLRCDTSAPVSQREVVSLALQVRGHMR